MTTENKRDLAADLAICDKILFVCYDEGGGYIAETTSPTANVDKFFQEACDGWEHAIRRAMAAEAEVAQLKGELMTVFHRAKNDVRRREGGMCVGTTTFADYPFARRLVRDLEPILFPEVNANDTQENNSR